MYKQIEGMREEMKELLNDFTVSTEIGLMETIVIGFLR